MLSGTDGKYGPLESATRELGRAINLRRTNLLGDFLEGEASVFERLPEKCFVKQKLQYTGSNYDYYASTRAFYSKLAVGAGLDASLQSTFTLGVTLSTLVQTSSSKESKVSGISLNVRALTDKILVDKDCLDNDATLTKSLVHDFERLPVKINEPWLLNSWRPYNSFLDEHGSHIITSVERGASIVQTAFAQSSESYSERDFQVKSCVSLAGPTSVGKIGVEACANVSKSEISKAKDMQTTDKLVLRGGTEQTRNKLRTKRTAELIEDFLNEASKSDSAVQHTFRPLWKILQNRFPIGSDNYVRALNLEYFYLGYLNYGCKYSESGGVDIQKFDYSRVSTKTSPDFQCTLASEGCHNNGDCHYKPIWCSCRGPSCIHYKSDKQDTGIIKTTAYANTGQDWGWHGCGWRLAGSWCECQNRNRYLRKTVWQLPTRDVVQKDAFRGGHWKFDTPDQSGEAEEDSLHESESDLSSY